MQRIQRSHSCVSDGTKLRPNEAQRQRKQSLGDQRNDANKQLSLPSRRRSTSNGGQGHFSSFSRRRSLSVPEGSRGSRGSSLKEEDEDILAKQEEAKYKYEPKIWQEFVQHILSINADIWNFDTKELDYTRDPSTVYNEALDELPQHLKPKPKSRKTQRNNRKHSGKAEKIKETKSLDGNNNDNTSIDLKDLNGNVISCENLSPIPEHAVKRDRNKSVDDDTNQEKKQIEETGKRGRNRSLGEETKQGINPTEDKVSSGEKKGNSAEIDPEDEAMKESKWEVIKQDIQEKHIQKLSDPSVGAWDKVAQVVGTLGQQNPSRQYLYKKYIERPEDWRRGLSENAVQKYEYIFTEADSIRKEYKCRNKTGKLPRLQERLRDKERPRTTPHPGRRGQEARTTSASSYNSGEEWNDNERPITAF